MSYVENQLEFKLIQNFKCKRCGCTNYDKMIYTGMKTLGEKNASILERYVCRNCDFVFDINEYISTENINMSSSELLNNSTFVDEGTDFQINGQSIDKEIK